MHQYIGTKLLKAEAMTLGAYNTYCGWTIPEGKDPQARGFLVEYAADGEPNHPAHLGHISWSPNATFKATYRLFVDGSMDFSRALEVLKMGLAVQREGWNGKNMFVYMVPANAYPAQTGVAKAYFGEISPVHYGGYFALKGVDDTVNTWVPSISDLLATDWFVSKQ